MTAADHANTDVLRTRLLGALNGYATDTETAWEIIKRWDALQAQAEQPWWKGADEMRAELRAAEAERDAAVQAAEEKANESAQWRRRAKAAEQAAEQARNALQALADYGPPEDTSRWNEMDSGHRVALINARAALAGNQT